jgi:Na+-transporting methylmalonyl-CoA/oxaloacetate decarboxylase gamma subunit
MEALNEITTTGAPGIVTAIGMGTVFLCLLLLYATTRIIGSSLARLLAPAAEAPSIEAVEPGESVSEYDDIAVPATTAGSAAAEGALVAAMTLALARHRSSRMRSVAGVASGVDPWKMAGRIRTLRDK